MGKFSQWLNDFFLFFPENKICWQFMQIIYFSKKTGFDTLCKVCFVDSLHEMSNPVFWGKYFKMTSTELFTQHAKH